MALFPYFLFAAVMIAANLYLLTRAFPRAGGTPHYGTVVLVAGLWIMASALWIAVIDAVVDPGDSSTIAVFIAGNSMMAVFGAWMIAVFYRAEESRLPSHGWLWPSIFAALVVGSELLMGTAFVLALAGPSSYLSTGAAGALDLTRDAVGSGWFAFAMLGNMALLLAWLPVSPLRRLLLAGLASSAAFTPWVVDGSWIAVAALTAVMGGVLAGGFLLIDRTPTASIGEVRTLLVVAVGFAAMGIAGVGGLVGGQGGWDAFPFAAVSLTVMTAELVYLGHWAYARPAPKDPGPVQEQGPAPTGAEAAA